MSLTLEEVRRVRFRMAKRNVTGYEVGDVDTFIDKVEESFAQFENERELLRREAESLGNSDDVGQLGDVDEDSSNKDSEIVALRAEVDRLKSVAAAGPTAVAPPTQEDAHEGDDHAQRLREQVDQLQTHNDELRAELERVRSELDEVRTARVSEVAAQVQTLKVGTRDDASPAVIRLVQLATEQAEQLVEEAEAEATRKIEDAKQQSHEITTDSRTKAERVESEARINAEQMTREAESRAQHVDTETSERRAQLFTELERQQAELSQKVDALRGFEASYRDNLKSYLHKHLAALDEDHPEPADAPEPAAQTGSGTPRLDALAQGHDD